MHLFTAQTRERVDSLGEERLITAIRRWLGRACPPPPAGIGDDCAVLPPARGSQLVTVDPVIYGRHFDDRAAPAAIGAKLLKRNLSDIAAMGGRPTAAVISLALDGSVDRRWLEAFYRGLARTARQFAVAVVGGDVAELSNGFVASVTLLGEATAGRALTRRGARAGDTLFVTGRLGGSLRSGRHLSFLPRLREGEWLARQPAVRSMIDLSDGLAKDVFALAPAGTVPALDPQRLPLHRGCDLRAALTDGEDYELLFTLDARADQAAFERQWRRRFPRLPLTRIGSIVRGRKFPTEAVDLARFRGFEHLRGAA